LPLSDKQKARFDEKASNDFYWKTAGHIYGYHNFIWGWIDTADSNFPPLLNDKLLPVLMQILEEVNPQIPYIPYGSGLNKRLGTEDLKIEEILVETAKRNMTLGDLYQMKEVDGWLYHGAGPLDGFNYVCSSYVIGHYIAAGLFDGFGEQQATEWSPKDVYQANFYNTTRTFTDGCAEDDSGLPVCQFLGKYKLTLPGLSSIDLYPEMNYHCPSENPEYLRPDGC
jgi:hypothetical protein